MMLVFRRTSAPSIPIYNISGLSGYQFLLVSSLDFFPRRTFETSKSTRVEYVGTCDMNPSLRRERRKEGGRERGDNEAQRGFITEFSWRPIGKKRHNALSDHVTGRR